MSRLARRFWGGVGQRILDSGALDGTQYRPGQSADEGARLSEYDRRWAYYLNDDVYGRLYRARLAEAAMPVSFNPVPAVVDFLVSTVLAGEPRVEPAAEDADGEALGQAVAQLWSWSNFVTLRRDLTVTAAVLMDVFVKVAERVPTAEQPATAVYMQDIPPQSVRWWDADERGYLTGIRIDTERLESVFTGEKKRHTLVEVWRKAWPDGTGGVRYFEIAPKATLDDTQAADAKRVVTFDELGYDFIPIVWMRVDTPWRRQVSHIDRYNEMAWRAGRLNRPLAVVGAGGVDANGRPLPAPLGVSDGVEALYSDAADGTMGVVHLPGMSTMQWAASPVDFAAMNVQLAELKETIIDGLPEYFVAARLRVSNVAEETFQMMLSQAGARALAMRDILERGLARAQMMAITIAQVAEVRPEVFARERIGTYEDGQIEHRYSDRPVFDKTAAAKAAEAGQHIGNTLGVKAAYLLAGYTEAEADLAQQIDTESGGQ